MTKPREFWISRELDGGVEVFQNERDAQYMAKAIFSETIHVIEKSAYDDVVAELIKTKKALRDTANGQPSEWAYVQLKADADKLAEALRSLKQDAMKLREALRCYGNADSIGDAAGKALAEFEKNIEVRND